MVTGPLRQRHIIGTSMLLFLAVATIVVFWSDSTRPWKVMVRELDKERMKRINESGKKGVGLDDLPAPVVRQSAPRLAQTVERCLTCHEAIEGMDPSHPHEVFGCTSCHGGDGRALTLPEAHRGLIGGANPSDLRVADTTCGQNISGGISCHGGRGDPAVDLVDTVRKSLMATMAGMIASLRTTWGEQNDPVPRYAAVGMNNLLPDQPSDTFISFDTIPVFNEDALPRDDQGNICRTDDMGNSIEISGAYADDHWRKFCSRCHLWSSLKATSSSHATGCAACHSPYNEHGTYDGLDPTISRDEPGHPSKHVMERFPPTSQCLHCHNRSTRIGTTYAGLMEDLSGTPFAEGSPSRQRWSGDRYFIHMVPDIHYEKGMDCIDCHPREEIMGDGYMYGRMTEAVSVRCLDCHGSYRDRPSFLVVKRGDPVIARANAIPGYVILPGDEIGVTDRGYSLYNMRREKDVVVLYSKRTGAAHPVTVITGRKGAHSIPGCSENQRCDACHSRWMPICYGCHEIRDGTRKLLDPMTERKTAGKWIEYRSYMRYEDMPLGLDADGEISPMNPCQRLVSVLDNKGQPHLPYDNLVLKNALGTSFIAGPVSPHSTRREVRPCRDCHLNPVALGLGRGRMGVNPAGEINIESVYKMEESGLPMPFGFETYLTGDGTPVQGPSYPGPHPLSRRNLKNVLSVAVCLPCHDKWDDPAYQKWAGREHVLDIFQDSTHRYYLLSGGERR